MQKPCNATSSGGADDDFRSKVVDFMEIRFPSGPQTWQTGKVIDLFDVAESLALRLHQALIQRHIGLWVPRARLNEGRELAPLGRLQPALKPNVDR